MAITNIEQLEDFLNTHLRSFDRLSITSDLQDKQFYIVLPDWFQTGKVSTRGGGTRYEERISFNKPDTAGYVAFDAEDNVSINGDVDILSVPYTHFQQSYAFDVREEIMHGSDEMILDHIKQRRLESFVNMAEEIEEGALTFPASGNGIPPLGLPYWVVYNATDGFTGGNPSGYSDCGGIDASSQSKWRNMSQTYTAVNSSLFTQMHECADRCAWKSPVSDSQQKDYRSKFVIYTTRPVLQSMRTQAAKQNDNLGRDLGWSANGEITFRMNPIRWVPSLMNDDESDMANANIPTDPIYMINHDSFKPVVVAGDYFRETGPEIVANQHNKRAVFIDLTSQYVCTSRRRNAVLATAA